MDPDDKEFLKFLKKNKVKIINKEMSGPGGGTPVITMQGKRKDLEKVLADEELGWADPDLAEYIEESVVNERFKFGTKNQYTIDDVNEAYGFWGTLDAAGFSTREIEDNWLSAHAWLTAGWNFSDPGALYFLNAKIGRWVADQVIERKGHEDVVDVLEAFATAKEWKKWVKEYNEYAQEELAENTNENMKQQFLYEKFSDFVEASFVNEKLGSMFFRDLLSKIGKYGNTKKVVSDVAKSFYNATNIALDKLEDSDFIISNNPTDAYKNTRGRDEMLFWISDNEKDNPYADSDGWNSKIPGGGVLLCITSGDRQVYTNSWDRWAPKKGYRLAKTSFKGDDPVGRLDNTKYRGWGATGINNGKRLAEISDRVAIINVSLLKQKYSTNQIRTEREAAKKGAIAFKSDKEFKAENLARYHEIIANKAAKLPLDSMVEDAINVLSSQIQDAIKAGKKDDYNNIMIGTNSKGRACTLRDATNHMSNILDDYSRYVGYIADAEDSEKRYGQKESYYERESKNYAKKIKEKIAKIEKFDYAW